jgi:hypothetical protein
MTERYGQEIEVLKQWYKANLAAFPLLVLTGDEYKSGTDSLKGGYQAVVSYAFWKWLHERRYELSYNQGCNAFFQALREMGKLEVGGEAPASVN